MEVLPEWQEVKAEILKDVEILENKMNELTSSKKFRLERLDTRIRASRSREKGVNLNKWPKRASTHARWLHNSVAADLHLV